MKKGVFYLLSVIGISLLTINCSENEESRPSENSGSHAQLFRKAGDSINIGYFDTNDDFIAYPDSLSDIKLEWEIDYNTTMTYFAIEKGLTIANPDDSTDVGGEEIYFLVGKTNDGREINMAVGRRLANVLAPLEPTLTVSCSGCSVGCRIESFKDTDKKLKYRCAVPCPECSKTETLTNAPKK